MEIYSSRGQRERTMYSNVSHDSRVIRGSTLNYVAKKKKRRKKKATSRSRTKRSTKKIYKEYDFPGQDDISSGEEQERNNNAIDLSEFLEEKTEKIKVKNCRSQTDEFDGDGLVQDEKKFFPIKTGIDRSVQVDGKLFNFEEASDPLVGVLVGKTIEQSLMEVVQEEEIKKLQNRQREILEKRKLKNEDIRKMEEEEKRMYELSRGKLKDEKESETKREIVQKKLEAFMYAITIQERVVRKVFNKLSDEGMFHDDRRKNVESFFPWLVGNVKNDLDEKQKELKVLSQILE